MEMANAINILADEPAEPASGSDPTPREGDRALAAKIIRTIREDKRHHERAFKRMKRDMFVATYGREESWGDTRYAANIVGRHIKQKTAALYAKNPKAVARRRETMDFRLWDENPQTLIAAIQFVEQSQQIHARTPPAIQQDPMTGMAVEVPPPPPPGLAEAQALIADAQAGMHRRQVMKTFGRTLEILFAHALRDQNPVDFKTAMKQVARRACTTGVGYIEIGFQREYGPRPESVNKRADYKTRLDHLRRLANEVTEGEVDNNDAEMAELEAAMAALQDDGDILLREGLVFDFPASTKVIPDRMCKSLVGFIGADHVTIEYLYTKEKVEEVFGVNPGDRFTPYQIDGKRGDGCSGAPEESGDDQMDLPLPDRGKRSGLVCVWKYYDKPSGLVYYLADGHDSFLREPAGPDIYVDDFWPVRALTFNAVESEDELFPPSDVTLLLDMQREINRSREGLREHRQAARPRWGYPNGALDDEDITRLQAVKAFDAIGLNIDPNTGMGKILQPIPVPGVDPNLYETGPFFTDMQLVAAAQAAQLGGLAKATATESAIAADSSAANDSSGVDDLDTFLTWVARSSGQIMLREMAPENVVAIAGPGAAWPGLGDLPAMDLEQIAGEVFLEVEAGSSGKPNQAIEIRNWKEMLPFLLQMGGIPPTWLARETLRRLDDRMDLAEAVVEGIPAIVAMNRNAQPATGDAATDPTAQGDSGNDKAPPPGGSTGTGPAFGNNRM